MAFSRGIGILYNVYIYIYIYIYIYLEIEDVSVDFK